MERRLVKTGGRLVKHARYVWLLPGGEASDLALIRVDAPNALGPAGADGLAGERAVPSGCS